MERYVYAELDNWAIRCPVNNLDEQTVVDIATWYADGSDEGPECIPECCWVPLLDLATMPRHFQYDVSLALADAVARNDQAVA